MNSTATIITSLCLGLAGGVVGARLFAPSASPLSPPSSPRFELMHSDRLDHHPIRFDRETGGVELLVETGDRDNPRVLWIRAEDVDTNESLTIELVKRLDAIESKLSNN